MGGKRVNRVMRGVKSRIPALNIKAETAFGEAVNDCRLAAAAGSAALAVRAYSLRSILSGLAKIVDRVCGMMTIISSAHKTSTLRPTISKPKSIR